MYLADREPELATITLQSLRRLWKKLSQKKARQISQHPFNVEYDYTEPIVVVLASY